MTNDKRVAERDGSNGVKRRSVLRSAAVAGAVLGGSGVAVGGVSGADGGGFPPSGVTEYGPAVTLGNGRVRPFTTETPSGEPLYHGVEFDRAAFEGLPTASELAASAGTDESEKYEPDGQALAVHRKWSLEFFVPFPGAEQTPFTFLGLNWNPGGHPGGAGAWLVPHFDVHFNMLDTATIDAIEGPSAPPYDAIPGELVPEGYARGPLVDERYITDMGEHLAPLDAPELPANPEAFTATLIQGFVGVDDGSEVVPRLSFVEPMITREYLRSFSGLQQFDVPQPEAYPHDQQHPTGYSVRAVPSKDAVAVVLEDFEQV